MILCIREYGDAAEVLPVEPEMGLVIPSLLSEVTQFDVYLVAHWRDAVQPLGLAVWVENKSHSEATVAEDFINELYFHLTYSL